MKKIYTAFLILLVLLGVGLMNWFHFGKKEPYSILEEQSALLSSLLPIESEPAEIAVPFAQNVPATVLPSQASPRTAAPSAVISPTAQTAPLSPNLSSTTPDPPSSSSLGTVSAPAVDATQTNIMRSSTPNLVPYFFFYTGMPVRFPQATNTFVYTTGFTPMPVYPPVMPVSQSYVPVAQSYGVPIFYPRVVQTRVGAPRLVYSNGVVIKPKVYFPNQPVRNTFRFIGR